MIRMDDATPPGLRGRKKQRTRKAIADAALALFLERGFDDVTLAEIADVAEVSVKTILNHFGSKEEVMLDEERAVEARLTGALKAPLVDGRIPLAPLRYLLAENLVNPHAGGWAGMHDAHRRGILRRFMATVHGSRALSQRWQAQHFSWSRAFADVAGARLGRHDDAVRQLGAFLGAVIWDAHRELTTMLLDGDSGAAIEARARELAASGLARVANAFPDLVVAPDGAARPAG